MGCQNSYITGYVGTSDVPLIGIIKDRSGGELQVNYYNGNTRQLYTGDLFTCCGGGSVSYSGCEAYITGFVGSGGEVLLAIVSGLDAGLLDVEYFDMATNLPYTGDVEACCSNAANTTTVEVVATGDDTTTNAEITGTVLGVMSMGGGTWTTQNISQVGTTISTTDGSAWTTGTTLIILMV